MAELVATRGTKLLIMLSDGASPPDYVHPCSINAARDVTFEKNLNEDTGVDCDDPDKAGWVIRDVVSRSCTVEGSGKLSLADLEVFEEWFLSDDSRDAIVGVQVAGGREYAGKWHLSNFRISGDRGAKAEVSITLVNDGELSFGPASAT
jgi:hypothetical protein